MHLIHSFNHAIAIVFEVIVNLLNVTPARRPHAVVSIHLHLPIVIVAVSLSHLVVFCSPIASCLGSGSGGHGVVVVVLATTVRFHHFWDF